ncbi:MAG: riboflavin synthase [bacterium]
MFTGIISATGRIKKIEKNKNFFLTVETKKSFNKVKLGDSIAVDGVCLTLAKIIKNNLVFEIMPETARLTIADDYKIGSFVNLERSLKVGDELGGHFVSGHVDGVGKVTKIKKEKESVIITFTPPKKLLKYLARKGSVAINGVSLTIINPEAETRQCLVSTNGQETFSVSLVTYTLENTNLSKLRIGDKINVEIDLLARYIEKIQYL